MNRFASICMTIALGISSIPAFADDALTKSYTCPDTITVEGKSDDSAWQQKLTFPFDGHTDLRPDPNNKDQQLLWCSYTFTNTFRKKSTLSYWVFRTVPKSTSCVKTPNGFKSCS